MNIFDKPNHLYTIHSEGQDKEKLLEKLVRSGVRLNEYALRLFQSDLYKPSAFPYTTIVIEVELSEIGLTSGGSLREIRDSMQSASLSYCPLELAPYIRLNRLYDKGVPELPGKVQGKAPLGSVTIFSEPLVADDAFPKGFYIRTIDGIPWLRGYRCSEDFIWQPDDRMIFKVNTNPTTT